jgi:hypothetical protein
VTNEYLPRQARDKRKNSPPKSGVCTQDASEEIKDLIDPTWRLGENYVDAETGEVLREDSEYLDRYPPARAVVAEAQAARL